MRSSARMAQASRRLSKSCPASIAPTAHNPNRWQAVEITDPTHAQSLVSARPQELQLEPYLSVAENIYLGRQPVGRFGLIDGRRMNRDARELLSRLAYRSI